MNFQPDQNKYKYNKEIEKKVSSMLGIILLYMYQRLIFTLVKTWIKILYSL